MAAPQVVTQSGNTVALTNSIRTQYIENYLEGAMPERLYDQLASPVGAPMEQLKRGSSVQVEFLSDMSPGTSAISEVTDISAQTLVDAVASITPTSRGEALQASERLMIQAFTDYNAKLSQRVGASMMETIDSLARDAATQGSLVHRNDTGDARSSLDAGSTSNRADDKIFLKLSARLQSLKVPGFKDAKNGSNNWAAIMHPEVFHDILVSGNVQAISQYQNASIILNHELGAIGGFRLLVSPWAKVFYGASTAFATPVNTEVKSNIAALDKTFVISVSSSVSTGRWLNILDTLESGDTHVSTNERVAYVSAAAKVITIVGEASNGGFRFPHTGTTAVVNNADSAYTIVCGGPDSLAKVYATEIGEYGQIVGPKKDGMLDQFYSLGYKWYGGYGRLRENGLIRAEVSVSSEA
jgi:N4-gp56 family major capsid protein